MKRLLPICISLALLTALYSRLDYRRLLPVLADCDLLWLSLSFGMAAPIAVVTSLRLMRLVPERDQVSLAEVLRLYLLASVLNMVLPSKMGDIAKAWFMTRRTTLSGSMAFSIVVFERSCDMLALLMWCMFGLMFLDRRGMLFVMLTVAVLGAFVLLLLLIASIPFAHCLFRLLRRLSRRMATMDASWEQMHRYFWRSKSRLVFVVGISALICFLHLAQIWMFTLSLKASVPFLPSLAFSSLAIFAGLLPLTFAGVGTRDAALVLFYGPFMTAPAAAAMGLLCIGRNLLPAVCGLPFTGMYFKWKRNADDVFKEDVASRRTGQTMERR